MDGASRCARCRDASVLVGNSWRSGMPPATGEPEFSSQEFDGVTCRIVGQRVNTVAGALVLRLADAAHQLRTPLAGLQAQVQD